MRIFIDQMQRLVKVPDLPTRIISLVPSQTELLFDLGLDAEIIGISKFCVHPAEKFKSKTKIGGTKNFNFDLIKELKPDLIIGNKEENYQEGILKLAKQYPVWMSDIVKFEDALAMIEQIGNLVNHSQDAQNIVNQIIAKFSSWEYSSLKSRKSKSKLKVAYLIWHNPLMIAGNGTFIDEMLQKAGFENAFAKYVRYPQITPQQLQSSQVDLIFLSSEPFPFKMKHLEEMQTLCPQAQTILVDGEIFSWYGTRLLQAVSYFEKLEKEINN